MTAPEVFELVLAGTPSCQVATALARVAACDRQYVLCSACEIHDEVARNCLATAKEVDQFLNAECPLYQNGVATCFAD